jgi:hypothetical protein
MTLKNPRDPTFPIILASSWAPPLQIPGRAGVKVVSGARSPRSMAGFGTNWEVHCRVVLRGNC